MLGRRYSRRRPTFREGITPRRAQSSTVDLGTCSSAATSRAGQHVCGGERPAERLVTHLRRIRPLGGRHGQAHLARAELPRHAAKLAKRA